MGTLRILLTDGNGVAGLEGVFGSFVTTASTEAKAYADAAAQSAQQSANSASASANSASASASSAQQSQTYASESASSATDSQNSAQNSQNSAINASNSATNAASSASAAQTAATAAQQSQNAAAASATNAATSETNAKTSETNAANSAATATTQATNAGNSATLAQQWAVQLPGMVQGIDYSAKYYAQQAAGYASSALLKANNLSDVASKPTSLANIGGVALIGSTMTGPLILSADPAVNLGASTKQYADATAIAFAIALG